MKIGGGNAGRRTGIGLKFFKLLADKLRRAKSARWANHPQSHRAQEKHLATHRFIARQPVLDREEKVYAYELIFRPGDGDFWPNSNGNLFGEEAITVSSIFEEIDEITEGARAVIRCSRQVLVSGLAAKLPKDRVILELLPTGNADEEVLTACRKLRTAGFVIALGNYQGAWLEPLADVVNLFRLDVNATGDRAQWLLIKKYKAKGMMFVADKVERRAQFEAAAHQGFCYFQGPFYRRPQLSAHSEVAPTKLGYLLVLGAVTRPEIDVQEVARAIKHDVALSYNLLRFLNSARFAFRSQIKSIRHALLLLGQNEVRKWVGLISVSALGEDSPPVLVSTALVRGALCESLAPLVGAPNRQSDYFFLGLLSCIDVLMQRPMRTTLAELPIAPDVSAALLGEENPLRDVLRMVVGYEEGNWQEFNEVAKKFGLNGEIVPALFLQALRWSRELTHDQRAEPVATACP